MKKAATWCSGDGVVEMPISLLHLSISCGHATVDCCTAFSLSKGVAEEHMCYMSNLRAGAVIFELLTACIIIELNLHTLTVTFCIVLSLFFMHSQYAVIHTYLMC